MSIFDTAKSKWLERNDSEVRSKTRELKRAVRRVFGKDAMNRLECDGFLSEVKAYGTHRITVLRGYLDGCEFIYTYTSAFYMHVLYPRLSRVLLVLSKNGKYIEVESAARFHDLVCRGEI